MRSGWLYRALRWFVCRVLAAGWLWLLICLALSFIIWYTDLNNGGSLDKMKQSELLRLIYDTIKNEYQPPNVISGSKYIGKGYFTDKQVNIINDIISEHFINYNIKYISLAIVKAISEHDPTIEKDIKDYSEIDKIIYRVKPPISE